MMGALSLFAADLVRRAIDVYQVVRTGLVFDLADSHTLRLYKSECALQDCSVNTIHH
jgi:hypothetical protein